MRKFEMKKLNTTPGSMGYAIGMEEDEGCWQFTRKMIL